MRKKSFSEEVIDSFETEHPGISIISKPRYPKKSKEFYRLWWEYLRQSPLFNEYAKYWNEASYGTVIFKLPEKFWGYPGFLSTPLLEGKPNICDYGATFEDWWKKQQSLNSLYGIFLDYFEKSEYDRLKTPFASDVSIFLMNFKKLHHGKEPTWQEFASAFPEWFERSYPHVLCLRVDTKSHGLKDLLKATEKVIRRKKTSLQSERTSRKRLDELGVYLTTYQEVQKARNNHPTKRIAWKKIIQAVEEKHPHVNTKSEYHTVRREFIRFNEYANRIIKNVELGIFPGRYSGHMKS